jgi:pimeloyl-ACP methyl ester carboxylesterase
MADTSEPEGVETHETQPEDPAMLTNLPTLSITTAVTLAATGVLAQEPAASRLEVPGATLHVEARGTGPTLLLIPGGPQDAGVFDALARSLASDFTVISFDPRCNSRSPCDAMGRDLDVGTHADDAAAVIEAVGRGPAYVFGTSGGAQVGLDLAARHPGSVRRFVAHEPPATMLLEDPEPLLAADRALQDTYRQDGVEAAMAQFFGMSGLDAGAPVEGQVPPEADETMGRVMGNFEYWLAPRHDPAVHLPPGRGRLARGRAQHCRRPGRGLRGAADRRDDPCPG